MSKCEDQQPAVFYFIGTTTGGSSIQTIFPKWMRILGIDAVLETIDVPVGADPRAYRGILDRVCNDPHAVGALAATHKSDLYRACADMFDQLDPLATSLGEVSCIAVRNRKLFGSAQDPAAARSAMDRFLMPGHWDRHKSDLLCLGAGGAGLAISYVAITRLPEQDRPARIVMADIDSGRLETLGHYHDRFDPIMPIHYHRVRSSHDNDALIAKLQPYSLIVNATGLGKARAGSPLSNNVTFPERSLIWELNYRGERRFLNQANNAADSRSLKIEDGWQYFVHGWARSISQVFEIPIDDEKMHKLAEIAKN